MKEENKSSHGISLMLSKEHTEYSTQVEECFADLHLKAQPEHIRCSDGELPMQITLFISQAIVGGVIYDLIKGGIKKLFKKFPNTWVAIRKNGILFPINKKLETKALVVPEREHEFEYIKSLDDLFELNVTNIYDGRIKTTIGKVVKVVNGGTPSTKDDSYWNGDISWITPKDLSDHKGIYISNGARSITKKGLNNSSAMLLPKNTVLFTSRAPIGYVAIADNEVTTNQGFKNILCNEKESHYKFFYYWFMNHSIYIEKISTGSTFSEASRSLIEGLDIFLPPIAEQRVIASVLSSLDDKIELLREQNKTLESITQTLFHEWFVKFNFPGATGEMVDSELGEIPKGWRVFELSELLRVINGYSYKGIELVEESPEALVTLKSFNRDGGFQTRGFKPFDGKPKESQEVKIGDLIVAHTDLTQDADVLGNPAFIFNDGGYNKLYITMDLVKIISKNKDISNSFFYYLMKTHLFKGHCVGYSNGTTVLHLSKKAIPEFEIALPHNLELVKRFSLLAKNITNKISINVAQIEHLSKTRDTLLPKLMSGEVRVKF